MNLGVLITRLDGLCTRFRNGNYPELEQLARIASVCWVVAVETIKIGYLSTCDCRSTAFVQWFFPVFQHTPYTYYSVYHGVQFLAGPYSLVWYLLDVPAVFGYTLYFSYLVVLDLAVFLLIYRKNRVYAFYYLTLTVGFTTVDPVDFFIIVFAVLGRYSLSWLVLAPLTKLPIGSEIMLGNFSVYQWVLSNPNSLHGAENVGRYLILIVVWLFSLCLYLLKHRRSSKSLQDTLVSEELSPVNSSV